MSWILAPRDHYPIASNIICLFVCCDLLFSSLSFVAVSRKRNKVKKKFVAFYCSRSAADVASSFVLLAQKAYTNSMKKELQPKASDGVVRILKNVASGFAFAQEIRAMTNKLLLERTRLRRCRAVQSRA